jgi:hypothetical protein
MLSSCLPACPHYLRIVTVTLQNLYGCNLNACHNTNAVQFNSASDIIIIIIIIKLPDTVPQTITRSPHPNAIAVDCQPLLPDILTRIPKSLHGMQAPDMPRLHDAAQPLLSTSYSRHDKNRSRCSCDAASTRRSASACCASCTSSQDFKA